MLGALLTVLGLLMLPAPGPGLPVVAAGAALLAADSYVLARLLDRLELKLRRASRKMVRLWRNTSHPARMAAVSGAMAALFVLGFIAYAVML